MSTCLGSGLHKKRKEKTGNRKVWVFFYKERGKKRIKKGYSTGEQANMNCQIYEENCFLGYEENNGEIFIIATGKLEQDKKAFSYENCIL